MRDYVNEGIDPPTPEEEEERHADLQGRSDGDYGPAHVGPAGLHYLNHERRAVRLSYVDGYQAAFVERKEIEAAMAARAAGSDRVAFDFVNADWMGCTRSEPLYDEWDNYTRRAW